MKKKRKYKTSTSFTKRPHTPQNRSLQARTKKQKTTTCKEENDISISLSPLILTLPQHDEVEKHDEKEDKKNQNQFLIKYLIWFCHPNLDCCNDIDSIVSESAGLKIIDIDFTQKRTKRLYIGWFNGKQLNLLYLLRNLYQCKYLYQILL